MKEVEALRGDSSLGAKIAVQTSQIRWKHFQNKNSSFGHSSPGSLQPGLRLICPDTGGSSESPRALQI